MTSIGETLRRERLRRNLDLGQISSELKISARFLEAIETEDFNKLPGGVFTKSFVRQYATLLGLDAEELASEVERVIEPPPDVPAILEHKPDVRGVPVEGMEVWQTVGETRSSWSSWVTALGSLVVVMLVCSLAYWWWERPRHPVMAHEKTVSAQPVAQPSAPASAVTQPPANPAPATPAPESIPAQPPADAGSQPVSSPQTTTPPQTTTQPQGSSPQPAATLPSATTPTQAATATSVPANPNATVHVGITADEEVWVRATVNGKVKFEATLGPHDSRTIDADGTVELRLGNAGGATITLNGNPIGPVGPKGQIRNVQLTSGGFKILSPKPPEFFDFR